VDQIPLWSKDPEPLVLFRQLEMLFSLQWDPLVEKGIQMQPFQVLGVAEGIV
jgi:hypothetical protein